jgi:integrase
MQFVQKKVAKGRSYLCFRKKGHPNDGQRLVSPWPEVEVGSELEREVAALMALETGAKPKASNLSGALRNYELNDPRWRNLHDSTKREYARYLSEFDTYFGHLPLRAFTASFLLDLQNEWARQGHRAAELRMTVMKNALTQPLIRAGLEDPFARLPGVPRPRRDLDPHPIWPEPVVEIVIRDCTEHHQFGIARAVAIGRYLGARRGDIVRLTPAHRVDGRVRFRSGKRHVPVDNQERTELTLWLDDTPATQPLSKWQAGQDRRRGVVRMAARTLVYNKSGDPYTEDGLGQELAKVIARLHAARKIDSDAYDLHGLRHTMGVELCLRGATDAQIAAYLGHSSPHSAAKYRRQADRVRLSDIAAKLLEEAVGTVGEPPAYNQVDNGVQLPATIHALRSP